MSGILGLVGSGEFTGAMIDVDKFLLKHTPNPVVAVFPTAAGEETDYKRWIDMGVKHFEKLRAKVFGVDLSTRKDSKDPGILKQIEEANFYYFSGGNPGYLFDMLKETSAWKLINGRFQNGATLVGSSAGAMVMGKKVWARVYDFARKGVLKPWENGLEVVDFGIVPHFDYIQNSFSKEKLEVMESNYPAGVPIIGIDENTAYIRIRDKREVMGRGKVHKLK